MPHGPPKRPSPGFRGHHSSWWLQHSILHLSPLHPLSFPAASSPRSHPDCLLSSSSAHLMPLSRFFIHSPFTCIFAQIILISQPVANWLSDAGQVTFLSEPRSPLSIRRGEGTIVGGVNEGSEDAQTIRYCSGLTGTSVPRLSQVCDTAGTMAWGPQDT